MYVKSPHTQIIYFENGSKRFIHNVVKVEESTMIHLIDSKGIEFVINKDKVNYSVIIPNSIGSYNETDVFNKEESNE